MGGWGEQARKRNVIKQLCFDFSEMPNITHHINKTCSLIRTVIMNFNLLHD